MDDATDRWKNMKDFMLQKVLEEGLRREVGDFGGAAGSGEKDEPRIVACAARPLNMAKPMRSVGTLSRVAKNGQVFSHPAQARRRQMASKVSRTMQSSINVLDDIEKTLKAAARLACMPPERTERLQSLVRGIREDLEALIVKFHSTTPGNLPSLPIMGRTDEE